jgi:hypothetical protein
MKDFSHIALFGGPPAGAGGESQAARARTSRTSSRLAKAKPGSISYGSPGNGTQGQLVAELFKQPRRHRPAARSL